MQEEVLKASKLQIHYPVYSGTTIKADNSRGLCINIALYLRCCTNMGLTGNNQVSMQRGLIGGTGVRLCLHVKY